MTSALQQTDSIRPMERPPRPTRVNLKLGLRGMNATLTDEVLVERFFEGCEESFEQLVNRYESKVFSTALYLTEESNEAEEVLFQVFADLHERLKSDAGKGKLFEWLVQHTLDISVERLISKKNEDLSLPSDSRNTVETREHFSNFESRNQELRQLLSGAISKLPLQLKFVFLLRDVQGLSLSKVSSILGITVFDARARLHRSRLFIYRRLSETLCSTAEQKSVCSGN